MTELVYKLNGDDFTPEERKYFRLSERAFQKAGITVREPEGKEAVDVIVHKSFKSRMGKLYPEVAKAQLSVTERGGRRPWKIHLSGENWEAIPHHLGSEYTNLDDYRVALISHELAHALGHDHVHCACVGCEADVRQQPSRGLRGCVPTTKVIFNNKSPHTRDNL